MPRFVLLRHECPPSFGKPSHWDFMLESGESLRTWDLRELPHLWANSLECEGGKPKVAAIPLPAHRAAYLDFEGPLSGDRGSVQRCDAGTYELLTDTATLIQFSLDGQYLRGEVHMEYVGSDWSLTALGS